MAKRESKATNVDENRQEIERVRQIIFGPQMRKFDQRFQETQSDLDRLQQTVDRLQEQLSDQTSDTTKKLQELRRDMRQSDDNIRTELRQTTDQLSHEKVDRLALGELFISLGTHLKTGGSLTDLMGGSLSDFIGQFSDE